MHRKLKGMFVVALAGCGATTAVETGTGPALVPSHCPDPSECTQGNGTGVYIGEGGSVGIGPTQLLITRFINNDTNAGSSVTFQGRYLDGLYHQWYELDRPGKIASATYKGELVRVASVDERLTSPRWTVIGNAGTISVIGDHLVDLKLSITFEVSHPAPDSYRYLLEFYDPGVVQGDRVKHTVHGYGLRWRAPNAGPDDATPYCFAPDATGTLQPDPVVFQQGMSVNPVTGSVTRNAGTDGLVTLSCSLGAIATAYLWGYEYRAPGATAYFDAGIQMKRASYCADGRTFTKAGTAIQIADKAHIIDEEVQHIEAWWDRTGALCLNPENRRHSEIAFDGTCNNVQLPPCPPQPPIGPYIIAGPVHPGP